MDTYSIDTLIVPYMLVRILDYASRAILILSSSDPLLGMLCILVLVAQLIIFGSPASTFRSLRTRTTLRTLLRTAVALTVGKNPLGEPIFEAPRAP
jgi:hypothetical protein